MLRITDEGSVPEMRIWSILLIKSDLKWCTHLSRSLFLYFIYMEHNWKKATLKPVAAKNSDATNLTRHFKGGHIIWKAV